MSELRFLLLGPLEVRRNGVVLELGPRKQRAVLGVLLLHANTVVATERLIDEVWGESPPETARSALQVYVARLRRALGEEGAALRTSPPGYVLDVPAGASDLDELAGLREEGRWEEALALWRGPALADLAGEPFAAAAVAQLEEQRLAVLEERIEADLFVGRKADLVPELEALVAEYPYRERFRAQLMLALYRAGRQADALAAYRSGRRRQVEELGLEPGSELQELERSILRQDAALDLPRARRQAAPRSRWRIAALGALVVAAAVAIVVGLFGRDEGTRLVLEPQSLGRIDPDANAVISELPLGLRPTVVAADGRQLWVAGREGTLARIDTERGRVTATVALGSPATSLAVGGGALWAGDGVRHGVTRIDRERAAVYDRFALPRPSVRAQPFGPVAPSVVSGGGSLWVSSGQDIVLRLDPRTGAPVATIRPPGGANQALAYGVGAVWVGGPNSLTRIAPSTGRVTSTIRLDGTPVALAVGAGAVWAALGSDGKVVRVDAETEAVEVISLDAAATALAAASNAVWAAVPSLGAVVRIDPERNEIVETVETGATPVALALVEGSPWVAVR